MARQAVMTAPPPPYRGAAGSEKQWRARNLLTDRRWLPSQEYYLERWKEWSPYQTDGTLKDAAGLREVGEKYRKADCRCFIARDDKGRVVAVLDDWGDRQPVTALLLDRPEARVSFTDDGVRLLDAVEIHDVANDERFRGNLIPWRPGRDKERVEVSGHGYGAHLALEHSQPGRRLQIACVNGAPVTAEFAEHAANVDLTLLRDYKLSTCRHQVFGPSRVFQGAPVRDGLDAWGRTVERAIGKAEPQEGESTITVRTPVPRPGDDGAHHGVDFHLRDQVGSYRTATRKVSYQNKGVLAATSAEAFAKELDERAAATAAEASRLRAEAGKARGGPGR
jgi:hypothetical protein